MRWTSFIVTRFNSIFISGITALASAADTTASVVLANKQADKQQRHNQAVEHIAAQGGELNTVFNRSLIDNDVMTNNNHLQSNDKGINFLLVSTIISIIQK